MLGELISKLDALIGIAAPGAPEQALLRERFTALKRQLPWLYAILFANLAGLQAALADVAAAPKWPCLAFMAVILVRMTYWFRLGHRLECSDIKRELRRTFLFGIVLCLFLGVWTFHLYWAVPGDDAHRIEVVMFATMTALGASYALNVFPASARLPLLLIALPLAVTMSIGQGMSQSALGISLIILVLLKRRLLELSDDGFVRLVDSRFAIEAEKQRAIEAERVALEEQSRVGRIANSDSLTGLANRRGFLSYLEQMGGDERRAQALILFDLDGFKPINDTFGHPTGDAMLIEVSRRLQAINCTGSIARLGGDEFAMLCDCSSAEQAAGIAKRAVHAIEQPFVIDGRKMMISACAGVSFHLADELADAMLRADVALYSAKRAGRGKVAVFCNAMQQEFQRRTSIEQALREPGLADTIELAFQPIFNLERMELRSFEALARWQHSELGWISPSEFIPITEQISLLEDMSNALLRCAARTALQWPSDIRLSFNLSAVQLCSPGSAAKLLGILRQEGLDPKRMQIEVTETALLADFEVARQNLSRLRANSVGIVLDDFGAGYSSISYLREMRFDIVKLDGSLISSVTGTGSGLALLRGVLALCRAMDQQCVAEHIESEAQLDLLTGLGCRYGQGYFLSPPVDAATAARLAWSATSEQRRSSAA